MRVLKRLLNLYPAPLGPGCHHRRSRVLERSGKMRPKFVQLVAQASLCTPGAPTSISEDKECTDVQICAPGRTARQRLVDRRVAG